MHAVIVFLTALLAIGPAFAQGPAGPIRKKPRPETAPRERLPPPPRIGPKPVERDREPAGYEPPSDPMLLKAIEANKAFDEKLPNFLSRQVMTRSRSNNLGKKWKQRDVVEAEVLIVDDVEEYREIKIDGEPTGAKDMSQIGGAWSMGEYGSVLWNLFIPPSRTAFTEEGPAAIGDRKTLVYKYEIEQENSRWTLHMNGRQHTPGHHGRVWIDIATGRAVKIEMEATFLPYDFQLNSASGVIEYDDVEIDGKEYLLPKMARNTVCVRDSAVCSRMDIEFRDYRKFSSESTLFTTDSDIDFGQPGPEGAETPEAQPGPGAAAPAPESEPKR